MKNISHYNDYTFLPFFDSNKHKDYTFEVELHIPKFRLRVLKVITDNKEEEPRCEIYLVVERIRMFHHREYFPKYIKYEASFHNFYVKDLYSPHDHLAYVL